MALRRGLAAPVSTWTRCRDRRRSSHGMSTEAAAGARVKSDINVTPLIDVVLVLLIIFLVVDADHDEGHRASRSRSKAEEDLPSNVVPPDDSMIDRVQGRTAAFVLNTVRGQPDRARGQAPASASRQAARRLCSSTSTTTSAMAMPSQIMDTAKGVRRPTNDGPQDEGTTNRFRRRRSAGHPVLLSHVASLPELVSPSLEGAFVSGTFRPPIVVAKPLHERRAIGVGRQDALTQELDECIATVYPTA